MIRKTKKDRLSTHKDKAWHEFSLYIRTRDSLKTTGSTEYCACVTCGRLYPRVGVGCIQAGHFIAGRTNAVLFSERGVNGQCYGCNTGKGGAHVEYFLWMEKNYGRGVIDELIQQSKGTVKYKAFDYDELARRYKSKTTTLLRVSS